MIQLSPFALATLACTAMACHPRVTLDAKAIRPWSMALADDPANTPPFLAHYVHGDHELSYVAAKHTVDRHSRTMQLIDALFARPLDLLIIESIPHDAGDSPQWYVDRARDSSTETEIREGEAGFAVIRAAQQGVAFRGGEPSDRAVLSALTAAGYGVLDLVGLYAVRQIPQWSRQGVPPTDIMGEKLPAYVAQLCATLACPPPRTISVAAVHDWYTRHTGAVLDATVTAESTAPRQDSASFLHRVSAAVGRARDTYTLGVIEDALRSYRRVAVVYGGSHHATLAKALTRGLGTPTITR